MVLVKVKLLGTEEDLDNGFYALMVSGFAVTCMEGEEYFVSLDAIKQLKEKKIKFKLIRK